MEFALWFAAGVVVGWVVFEKPQWVRKGVAFIKGWVT